MKNNYDTVARHYDWLSKVVFYRSQVKAQICLLPYIGPQSRVLIAGGGTGWILEEIAKKHPQQLEITYVEISGKMITLSQERDHGAHTVHFVHQGIEEFMATAGSYDIIMTPFLFDNFSKETAERVFYRLHQLLTPDGKWLFTDFVAQQSRWWQKLLLKSMYLFFRLLCDIEASQLTDMQPLFQSNNYQQLYESFYYFSFIRSAVYKKN